MQQQGSRLVCWGCWGRSRAFGRDDGALEPIDDDALEMPA